MWPFLFAPFHFWTNLIKVRLLIFSGQFRTVQNCTPGGPEKSVKKAKSPPNHEHLHTSAFSSCFMYLILVHMRLPFFKVFLNFVHFCPNFLIFCTFLPFFALVERGKKHFDLIVTKIRKVKGLFNFECSKEPSIFVQMLWH